MTVNQKLILIKKLNKHLHFGVKYLVFRINLVFSEKKKKPILY